MTASWPPSVAASSRPTCEGRDERRAARPAGQDPLLAGQPAGRRERVAIRDAHPAIDRRRIERAGQEVLADPLGQVRPRRVARQDAALGIGADRPGSAGFWALR